MTTIAVDKTSMSSDLQFTHSGGLKFKGYSKCLVLKPEVAQAMFSVDKAIIGACGNADKMALAWAFLTDPTQFEEKIPKFKGVEFVGLLDGGKIVTSGDLKIWMTVEQPFYSIGSGSHIAMGAMAGGTDTKKAVLLASKHDPMTGMGTKTYKL